MALATLMPFAGKIGPNTKIPLCNFVDITYKVLCAAVLKRIESYFLTCLDLARSHQLERPVGAAWELDGQQPNPSQGSVATGTGLAALGIPALGQEHLHMTMRRSC